MEEDLVNPHSPITTPSMRLCTTCLCTTLLCTTNEKKIKTKTLAKSWIPDNRQWKMKLWPQMKVQKKQKEKSTD